MQWSHLELKKLGQVNKHTQAEDETEEGHPVERLLEGREDGAGPFYGDDHHHVDGAGNGHVLNTGIKTFQMLLGNADLDGVDYRYEVGVPLHVHLQPLQPGVHQEDHQEEGVDDGEAAEEVGEGGGDVVAREDDDGDGVGENSQDTETGEENTLEKPLN